MFANREEAGRLLAESLKGIKGIKREKGVVLAIPRGGVVVGKEIAKKLGWPLDVVVVKKIGAPGQPELAIGAVAERGVKVVDWEMALRMGVEQEWLDREVKRLKLEVREKAKKYMICRSDKTYKTYILTDDGVATGATMEAGIKNIKNQISKSKNKIKIILAIPVGARETVAKLRKMVDETIVFEEPAWFSAVGQFYREFPEVKDEEVVKMLRE